MSIEVKCTGCGQLLRVQEENAGKQARCPKCQTTFTVPSGSSGASPFGGQQSTPQSSFPQEQSPLGQQPQQPYNQPGQGQFGQQGQQQFGQHQFGQQGQNPFANKPAAPAQNPYAAPQGTFPQGPTRGYTRPHRGGTILTLGILAIFCNFCFIPGICAWSMGSNDLNAMRRGQMDPRGRGTTQAGQILGIIGTILSAILGIANIALRAGMQ